MEQPIYSARRMTLLTGAGLASLLTFLVIVLAACGQRPSDAANGTPPSLAAGTSGGSELVINVSMDEFSYSPDTLRIPAGQPVRIVLENVGGVPHEFMAGRSVTEDGTTFTEDLFAGVHVQMSMAMDHEGMEGMDHEDGMAGMEGMDHEDGMAGMEGMDHEDGMAGMEGMDHEDGMAGMAGMDHEDGMAGMDHEDGMEGMDHEDGGHGTMLLLPVQTNGVMEFTLPESRRGTWSVGCFQPGHYQAGMTAVLIVE
jgi:uncharacterized cupredoxin-like copper-binding protein